MPHDEDSTQESPFFSCEMNGYTLDLFHDGFSLDHAGRGGNIWISYEDFDELVEVLFHELQRREEQGPDRTSDPC